MPSKPKGPGRPRIPVEEPASERTERRRRQRVREGEPEVTVNRERPKLPPGMPRRAQTLWKQYVAELEGLGILARSDAAAVEALARLVARAREASAAQERCGSDLDARLKWYDRELRAWGLARPYIEQLGLSVRGRTALGYSITRPQDGGRAKPPEPEAPPAASEGPAGGLPGLTVVK